LEKVALFRSLCRGRDDVYALRQCVSPDRPGLCEKPRISWRDCNHRELQPSVGLYPLLDNDHGHLLAVDFDEQDWREDARAFLRSCRQLQLSSYDRLFPNGPAAR
jgi:hypothetical protein